MAQLKASINQQMLNDLLRQMQDFIKKVENENINLKFNESGLKNQLDNFKRQIADMTSNIKPIDIPVNINKTKQDIASIGGSFDQVISKCTELGKIINIQPKFDKNGDMQSFIVQLERAEGIIDKIKLKSAFESNGIDGTVSPNGQFTVQSIDLNNKILQIEQQKSREIEKQNADREKALQYEQQVRQALENEEDKQEQITQKLQQQVQNWQESKNIQMQRLEQSNQEAMKNEKIKQQYKDIQQTIANMGKDSSGNFDKNFDTNKLKEANNQFKQLNANVSGFNQELKGSNSLMSDLLHDTKEMERQGTIGDRLKSTGAYAMAASSIYMVTNSVRDAINTNKEYEASLTNLGRILGNVTKEELKEYGKQAIQLSKEFGVSLREVQDAMSGLAAAGVQDKSGLLDMTKTILMGLNTSDIKDASEMTDLLVSSLKQMNISFADSSKVLDSWNLSADKHIAKTADYAQAVAKAGATSKAVGIDINELNGIVSVLADNTGKSGTEIGDALKAIETRISRPETLKVLQQYGIEVMKDKDHFRDFSDIMKDAGDAIQRFGDNTVQSNAILDALGGTQRKNWAQLLVTNYNQVDSAAKESADSIGYSATKNAATMDTLSKKIEVFNATVKEMFIALGDSGALNEIKNAVDGATSIVEAIANLPKPLQQMLYILPQVAIGVKVFSESLRFITGSNLTQWLDKANLSFTALGHTFSTGGTSIKGYEAAVQSLSKEIIAGNITAEESATILNIVGQKMGIAKSSTNVLAAAEQALNAQVAAGTITKQEATIALDALKLKTAANATTSAAATASNTALAASQRAVMMSSLALSAIIAGVTLGISALIIGFSSFHRSVSDVRNDISDLSQKMNETNENDQLIKKYKALEDQLKNTGKSSEDYGNIQSQILELQRQLAEKFPTLISGYDAEGKAIASNYDALKKYNNEKKVQIAGEQGKNYDDLRSKLTSSVGSWQMNQIDIYNSKKQQMDTYEKNGQWEKYDNATSSIKDISKNIDSLNNSAATLYYALGRDTEMFDTQTGKWIKYSQFIKQNSSITEGNTSKKKENTDANLENGDAIEKASEQVDTAYTIQKKYQESLTTSTDNVKDYSKYIKEMNDNSGHLKAASVEDIIKNHPELIQYLGNEKTLYDQINNAINTNKENAQQAYMGIMVSREQNNQQLLQEIETYQQLESSHKTDAETRKQMSDIAKSLAGQIEGLIVVTDAEGNSRIQNIGLLNSQMNMLSQEGEAYKALANVKISTTKESSIIDTGATQTTYANAKARIGVIMAEVQALQAKRDAEAAVASVGGAMDMPTDQAFKPYNDEINAKQANIQKIQDAMNSLDKLWSDSGKYKSSVLNNMDITSEGLNKTEKQTSQKTKENAALTAQSRELENQSRDLTIQSRNLEAESRALDAKSKTLNIEKQNVLKDLENNYKVEQQHIEDIIKGYDKELDALKEKKQIQDDTNSAIDYQNKLIKDQQALDNAMNEKTVMVSDGNGNVSYIADQSKIDSAREQLAKDQEDYRRWQADQAIQAQEDLINKKIDIQQEAKDTSTTAYNNKKDSIEESYQAKLDAIDASKDSIENKKQAISDARSDLDEKKNELNSSRNSLDGYAKGTNYVPETKQYLVGEEGTEIVTLPQGASVTPNDETEKILNNNGNSDNIIGNTNSQSQSAKNTLNAVGTTINNNKNLVKRPVGELLNEVDNNIQRFVNESPQYGKDSDKNIGDAVTNNKLLVKKPVDNLVTEIANLIQNFVNNADKYGKDTDKNIGTGINNTQESVLNPTRNLISNVKGIIDPFVASNIDQGKNIDINIGKGMSDSKDDLIKNIEDLCKQMVDKFNEKLDIHSPSKVMYKIGQYMIEGLIKGMDESDIEKFITDKVGGMTGSINGQVANVPGNVTDWLREAIKLTGVPESWLPALQTIAMHESSGNPNDINTWDSNAKAGHPSQGLMQTIPSTFAENMVSGHNQILNPIDNAAAAINYIKNRYGNVSNVPGIKALARGGSYVGYQNGTESTPETDRYQINENGEETVLLNKGSGVVTAERTRSLNLLADNAPNIMDKINNISMLMPQLKLPDFSNIQLPKQTQKVDNSKNYHINNVEIVNPDDFEDFVTQFELYVANHG